jgi:hypothetical protein
VGGPEDALHYLDRTGKLSCHSEIEATRRGALRLSTFTRIIEVKSSHRFYFSKGESIQRGPPALAVGAGIKVGHAPASLR